jgi:acetyl esterase/lipase
MASTLAIKARLGARLMAAAAATAAQRARHGARRPGWPFSFETRVAFLRREYVAQARLPWGEQRVLGEALGSLGKRLADVEEHADVIAGVPCAWFRSAAHDAARGAVIVYLHGGSYIYGSVASHRELTMRVAKACAARVCFPIYRLAPEHPFPAAIDDAVAVTQAIVASVGARRVVLAGDSAGGGLAVATLLRLRDDGATLPAAAALISPWVELDARGGSLEQNRDDWGEPWMFERWARSARSARVAGARRAPRPAAAAGGRRLRRDAERSSGALRRARERRRRRHDARGLAGDGARLPGLRRGAADGAAGDRRARGVRAGEDLALTRS